MDIPFSQSFAVLSEGALSVFPDYDAVLVVSPEATAPTDVLSKVIENDRLVVVVAASSDGVGSWAASIGITCFPYPMSGMDQNNLIEYLSRYTSGGVDKSDMYRRVNLGGELISSCSIRNDQYSKNCDIQSEGRNRQDDGRNEFSGCICLVRLYHLPGGRGRERRLFFVTIFERVRTRTTGPYSRRSQMREACPKKLRIVPHFPWSPRMENI